MSQAIMESSFQSKYFRAGRLVRRERQFEDNEEQQLLIEEQVAPVQVYREHEDQQEQEQVIEQQAEPVLQGHS